MNIKFYSLFVLWQGLMERLRNHFDLGFLQGQGLWVDDLRPLPNDPFYKGWHVARSFHEAIYMLERHNYKYVSLDHDIASFYGDREMSGYDILMYLVALKVTGMPNAMWPEVVYVHTANPVAREKMNAVVKKYFPGKE